MTRIRVTDAHSGSLEELASSGGGGSGSVCGSVSTIVIEVISFLQKLCSGPAWAFTCRVRNHRVSLVSTYPDPATELPKSAPTNREIQRTSDSRVSLDTTFT